MEKHNYWTSGDTQMIITFYYCCTASTSASTRNKIFTALQPNFNYLIDNAINTSISSWSKEDKEDLKQETLIFFWFLLQNKLNPDKLQGILNFLWVCARQHIYLTNRIKKQKKKPKIEYTDSDYSDQYFSDVDDLDIKYNQEALQYEIMLEIDNKIKEQEKLNRTNTLYLVLLKEYLLANQYDCRGFRDYIKDKLQINDKNFWQINHTLGIKSKVFNQDKNISE